MLQVAKSITVFHAVQWVTAAWKLVRESTVAKCFTRCGFGQPEPSPADEEWEDEDLEPLLRLVPGATAKELVEMDEATSVCATDDPVAGSVASSSSQHKVSSDEEEPEPPTLPTLKEACHSLDAIIALAMKHDKLEMVQGANVMKEQLLQMRLRAQMQAQQTSIKDFLSAPAPME